MEVKRPRPLGPTGHRDRDVTLVGACGFGAANPADPTTNAVKTVCGVAQPGGGDAGPSGGERRSRGRAAVSQCSRAERYPAGCGTTTACLDCSGICDCDRSCGRRIADRDRKGPPLLGPAPVGGGGTTKAASRRIGGRNRGGPVRVTQRVGAEGQVLCAGYRAACRGTRDRYRGRDRGLRMGHTQGKETYP